MSESVTKTLEMLSNLKILFTEDLHQREAYRGAGRPANAGAVWAKSIYDGLLHVGGSKYSQG